MFDLKGKRVIRVFCRKTSYTPVDDMAFVGEPPLMRPEADEVHISVVFSWDVRYAEHLQDAWEQYYPKVRLGGPAMGNKGEGFTPGMYIKPGVTFSSRGCPNACNWCLVPEREGRLRLFDPIAEGYIIGDNNLLSCPSSHRWKVFEMLRRQKRAAIFSGGLQASLVTDEIAEELRGLRIDSLFLAADTEGALKPLAKALGRLSFLPRRKLRCYVLCAYNGETIEHARARLERVWEMGAMPFAMLYQPPERWIDYACGWRALARQWSRPAAMFASHPSGLERG